MWVKICGITRLEDALAASEVGADAIGFVFWPSSARYLDFEAAERIVAGLPRSLTTVGVFVDQPLGEVNATARRLSLGAVQLHGNEGPDYWALVAAPVIKAVRVGSSLDTVAVSNLGPGLTVLIDAADPVEPGGTGRVADWMAARQVARSRRVILAGGLTPENVARAVRTVQPFGVDVSSGVESRRGVKDRERMRQFLDAARICAAELESHDDVG